MSTLFRLFITSLSLALPTTGTAQSNTDKVTETVVTVQDLNGAQRVSERVVTRTTQSKEREDVIIETYSPLVYARRLDLSQRVRRVTTLTSDGSHTVEEVEEPPPGSPHEPMRVVQRTVTTVRKSEGGEYLAERKVFDRDVNGRLVPRETQIERSFSR